MDAFVQKLLSCGISLEQAHAVAKLLSTVSQKELVELGFYRIDKKRFFMMVLDFEMAIVERSMEKFPQSNPKSSLPYNITSTAKDLGINRTTLIEKLKKWGVLVSKG